MTSFYKQVEEVAARVPGEIPTAIFGSDRPAVIRNLVNEWPLVEAAKHSPERAVKYLNRFYTDKKVVYYEAPAEKKGRYFYNSDCTGLDFVSGHARLDEILERLLALQKAEPYPSVPMTSAR